MREPKPPESSSGQALKGLLVSAIGISMVEKMKTKLTMRREYRISRNSKSPLGDLGVELLSRDPASGTYRDGEYKV